MNPDDLEFLTGLVRARTGLVLRGDKAYFAQTRLAPLARREGAGSEEALVTSLRATGAARLTQAAGESMTIADTAFFRDMAVFDHIREVVLPELAASSADGQISIWCAGCSTGQEAYSLAIIADEVRSRLPNVTIDIIGTDLSRRALEKAHSGLYTQFEVQRGLPIRTLLEHFHKADDMWCVSERLRQTIRWRQLNLLEDRRSVRRFDLLLCRNVTSGFEPETRRRVQETLTAAMGPGGYLVLGANESAEASGFESAGGGLPIFRRALGESRAAA